MELTFRSCNAYSTCNIVCNLSLLQFAVIYAYSSCDFIFNLVCSRSRCHLSRRSLAMYTSAVTSLVTHLATVCSHLCIPPIQAVTQSFKMSLKQAQPCDVCSSCNIISNLILLQFAVIYAYSHSVCSHLCILLFKL